MTVQQIRDFVRLNSIPAGDARSLAARATDPGYWRSLCRDLSIGKHRAPALGIPSAAPEIDNVLSEYERSGYFVCEHVFQEADLERIKDAIFEVQRAGWPMVFAFVYDQLWTVLEAPKLCAFLTTLLGPHYQTTARFWVNYVPPGLESSGFPPHMDGGRGHTVTCWVPLMPSVPDNGCIYVVERTSVSRDVLRDFKTAGVFTRQQMCLLLSHARAIPLPPGGFLAWPQDTIHWGGIYRRGDSRIALSWELMPTEYENLDSTLSLALWNDEPLPAFGDRLRWVCHSLSRFEGRNLVLTRFMPVVRQILLQIGPARGC